MRTFTVKKYNILYEEGIYKQEVPVVDVDLSHGSDDTHLVLDGLTIDELIGMKDCLEDALTSLEER